MSWKRALLIVFYPTITPVSPDIASARMNCGVSHTTLTQDFVFPLLCFDDVFSLFMAASMLEVFVGDHGTFGIFVYLVYSYFRAKIVPCLICWWYALHTTYRQSNMECFP